MPHDVVETGTVHARIEQIVSATTALIVETSKETLAICEQLVSAACERVGVATSNGMQAFGNWIGRAEAMLAVPFPAPPAPGGGYIGNPVFFDFLL